MPNDVLNIEWWDGLNMRCMHFIPGREQFADRMTADESARASNKDRSHGSNDSNVGYRHDELAAGITVRRLLTQNFVREVPCKK